MSQEYSVWQKKKKKEIKETEKNLCQTRKNIILGIYAVEGF